MVWPSCIACTSSSLAVRSYSIVFYWLKLVLRGGSRPSDFRPRYAGMRLNAGYVLCLQTLRTLFHFEFHRLSFIQGLVAVHGDGREVYEYIFSGLTLDKSKTLRSVKPLYCSLFLHCFTSCRVTPVLAGIIAGIALLLSVRTRCLRGSFAASYDPRRDAL